MKTPYFIRSVALLCADSPQNIDFHIRSGDYFSFLATLMGYMEELSASNEVVEIEKARNFARELRHDLRYVQANYKIVPRDLSDIQIVRPSGNLLLK